MHKVLMMGSSTLLKSDSFVGKEGKGGEGKAKFNLELITSQTLITLPRPALLLLLPFTSSSLSWTLLLILNNQLEVQQQQ